MSDLVIDKALNESESIDFTAYPISDKTFKWLLERVSEDGTVSINNVAMRNILLELGEFRLAEKRK